MADDRSKRRKITKEIDDSCLAVDAIKLHLSTIFFFISAAFFSLGSISTVSSADEFNENANTFCPEFVEEHFGEDRKIHGYHGLKVDIWVHNATFHVYADIKYDAIFQLKKKQKTLIAILKEIFGAALIEDRDTFLNMLPAYNTQFSQLVEKFGEKLFSSQAAGNSSSSSACVQQVYRFELDDPEVREWHDRLNPFILWFVESASCIDASDPRWEVYVALESSQDKYRVTGVSNVYRFFHYFDSTRLRISQILVFPPYQNKHYGYELVRCVNEAAMQRDCFDVTMEDPSDRLQRLRDCIDVIRLLNYQPVVDEMKKSVELAKAKNRSALLPPRAVVASALKDFKISKQQMKRCWEVLLFLNLATLDESGDMFRELLSASIHAELYGAKDKEPAKTIKRIVDTENMFDSSKTFVMLKFPRVSIGEEAEEDNVSKPEPELVDKLLKQREEGIVEVVKKVARLRGLSVKV